MCSELGEIELEEFFPLNGVIVEKDVARFPECKLYYSRMKSLIFLRCSQPRTEWYKFLNTILDAVQQVCVINELYAIGSMISFAAHTKQRMVMAIANSTEMKELLNDFDVNRGFDYESPPGQRPSLSNYLMWVAAKRNIIGASLWVPIPFYLVSNEDPCGYSKIIDFLNSKLNLGIDLTELERDISRQDELMDTIKLRFPEVDDYITRLEGNLGLSEEQSNKLVEIMDKYLGK
jgi:predicted ATP-grasp superfamily ATP-dependent carboligase